MDQQAYLNSFIGKATSQRTPQHAPKRTGTVRKKTGYKGITKSNVAREDRFTILITHNGKRRRIGYLDNLDDALKTLDDYATKHNLEKYRYLTGKPQETLPKLSEFQPITIDGVDTTIRQACLDHGRQINTVRYRVDNGMDVITAIKKPTAPNRNHQSIGRNSADKA